MKQNQDKKKRLEDGNAKVDDIAQPDDLMFAKIRLKSKEKTNGPTKL